MARLSFPHNAPSAPVKAGSVSLRIAKAMPPTVPIVVIAGQSNAEITSIPSQTYALLHDMGGAFEFVHVRYGGTSMFQNDYIDWDPRSRGEIADQLVSEIRMAADNVRSAGGIPSISILWVHGETDAAVGTNEFQSKLLEFIDFIRAEVGEAGANFVIAPLPFEGDVRTAQLGVGRLRQNIHYVDTLGAPTFDGAHYTHDVSHRIAAEFMQKTGIRPAAIRGYDNLLPEMTIEEQDGQVTIRGNFYEALDFSAPDDARPHFVHAGLGDDTIELGPGDDWVNAWDGIDFVSAGSGHDFINTGLGAKVIYSGPGNDTVWTGFGDDLIYLGDGDDHVRAGNGSDRIFGEGGDDRIEGREGVDELSGGTGADVFVYATRLDSVAESPDLILDFESGNDRIDLSELGRFAFISTDEFSASGQVRYEFASGRTYLSINIDDTLSPELVIALQGEVTLTPLDFVTGSLF